MYDTYYQPKLSICYRGTAKVDRPVYLQTGYRTTYIRRKT